MTSRDKVGRFRQYAVVLTPWEDSPKYHAYGTSRLTRVAGGPSRIRDETVCNRTVVESDLFVPLKHAMKFGQPCQQCWAKEQLDETLGLPRVQDDGGTS